MVVSAPRAQLRVEALEDRIVPTLDGNTLFPADNPWNQVITNAPVAANSATLVNSIGASLSLHPDFGTTYAGALNGIPYNDVPGTQPKIHVVIDAYASESDLLDVPIPDNAVIEGDPLSGSQNTTDRHLIVYDHDNNIIYELFNTHRPSEESDNQWHADAEAVWYANKDWFRPQGWTSADAAGLPILPGLVRPDEVLDQGKITHALRFTVPATDNTWIFPASHEAGTANPALPRMGERFRLRPDFPIASFSAADQVILQALKTYGMIVADNGSSWYLSGVPSSRWSDDDLHNLTQVHGSDFQAVDLTPQVSSISPTSGSAGTAVIISGLNFSGGAGLTTLSFGTTAAPQFTINSDTQITVTAPAGSAGSTVDVIVHSPYGDSATSSADQFTYTGQNSPTVTGVSPNMGPLGGGNSVTITGTNFLGTTLVQFGTVAASSFTVESATQILAVAPAHKAGTVDVFVTNASGKSSASSSDQFTYLAAPTVTSLSPTSGPTSGGTSVTITGTNFVQNNSQVTFGTAASSSVTFVSSTKLIAVAPAHAAATVDVHVTTPGGTSATRSADRYRYKGSGGTPPGAMAPSGGLAGGTWLGGANAPPPPGSTQAIRPPDDPPPTWSGNVAIGQVTASVPALPNNILGDAGLMPLFAWHDDESILS